MAIAEKEKKYRPPSDPMTTFVRAQYATTDLERVVR